MTPLWLAMTLLALVGAATWVGRQKRQKRQRREERERRERREPLDEAELRAAEDEVRDLDALATPEDATDELPDWGPGAVKPPRHR